MISTQILGTAEKYARFIKITKGAKQLSTPTFFPAISGLGFGFQTKDILELLLASTYPRVLVSCYDVSTYGSDGSRMIGELSQYFRKGAFIMLDSGVFESYWRRDHSWNFNKYRRSVSRIDSDFYFGFDVLPNPKSSEQAFQRSTILQAEKSSSISKTSEFIPIVHGRTPQHLVSVVKGLITQPQSRRVVAVPERDCGRSLSERAKTVLQIRHILDEKDNSIILHVLGCGNPVSLALFAYCGADTFDSLNWTKMTIDRNDLKLTDLVHLELLDCSCGACSKGIADPISRTLLHNLLFYQEFALRIQNMIRRETLWDFLVEYVGLDLLNTVRIS